LSSSKVYHVYEVIVLKKTESVTYRTDRAMKNVLLQISKEKKWTISQLSEEIIREWLTERYPQLMEEDRQTE